MKKLFVVIQLLIVVTIYAQSRNGTVSQTSLIPQGFGLNLLNSSGTSSIFNDVSNLTFMNPASISQFENYSFGFSYQFNTYIEDGYHTGIGTNRIYNFIPQSFGGVLKLYDFTFGLGFGQMYNLSLDYGPIPITTEQNPYGTGDYFTPISETAIQDFVLTAAYSFENMFYDDRLNFGLKLSIGRFYDFTKLVRTEFNTEDYRPAFSVGIHYEISLDEYRWVNLGIMYQSKIEFEGRVESNSPPFIIDPDPIRDSLFYVVDVVSYISAYFPEQINTDLSIDVTENFKLLTSFNTVLWKSQPSMWENQFTYSTSAVYKFSESTSASLGFYSSDMELREENYFSREDNEFSVFFLTAGLKLSLNKFNIDIALADSHLMSGEFREQTIGKIAVGLHL